MNQQLCHISVRDQLSFVINTGVDIRMLSRKLLSLVIVFIMLLGLLFPASASNIAQNAENTELHWLSPGPKLKKFSGYCSDIYGVAINGHLKETDTIEALIYDKDRPEDFKSVKTVTLSRDDRLHNLFVFRDSDLTGLKAGKVYYVAILLDDKLISSSESAITAAIRPGGSSGSDPGTGGKGGTVNGASTGRYCPAQEPGENPEVVADDAGVASVKKGMLEIAESLTVKSDAGDTPVEMVFDKEAVGVLKELDADLEISISGADVSKLPSEARKLIGDRPVYDITVTADGKSVTDFGTGLVTIRIPYAHRVGEDPDAIVVCFIGEDGEMSIIT